jgi:AcrR family transcriptional regulator
VAATAAGTRERLIECAGDLFYRDGFHAVGLDRILNDVGVTKTTFYNHFESKESLVLEVLRTHDDWWRRTFQKLLREQCGDDPRAQLQGLFKALKGMLNDDSFNGCIFVNVAAEFPLPHDPIHIAAKEHKQAMELILRDLALRGRATDPIALSEELAILMEGAYVTQQITRNPATADIAARAAQCVLKKYLP